MGSGFDRDDLERAGAVGADALAAVTSGDNTNILTVRIARETYEIPRVVARIYDPRGPRSTSGSASPPWPRCTWTIDQVRRQLLPELVAGEWADATGKLSGRAARSPSAGPAGGWPTSRSPARCSLVGGHPGRGPPARRPPSWSARRATMLHLAVMADALAGPRGPARATGAATRRPARRTRTAEVKVAIAGAGSVGTAIARDLHASGHEVLVLEQDPDLVERRRDELDVTWLAADACEVSSLDAAGLATVDVVVAATGDDEDNLVISLLAKQEFAVPRVVARVNNSKNQWLFNESWGVDVSVSTPQLLTALVEEAVSVGSLVRLLQFQGGHGPPGGGHPGRRLAGGGDGHRRPRDPPRCHGGGRGARRPPGRAEGRHRPAGRRRGLVLVTADAEQEVHRLFVGD